MHAECMLHVCCLHVLPMHVHLGAIITHVYYMCTCLSVCLSVWVRPGRENKTDGLINHKYKHPIHLSG